MKPELHSVLSLSMTVAFGVVGLVFVLMSSDVILFFNMLSRYAGMEEAVPGRERFYVALAGAYMYLVTVLAYLLYRYPDDRRLHLLLLNGKCASSALSLLFFFFDKPLLVYMTNGVVDATIGLLVIAMMPRRGRRTP